MGEICIHSFGLRSRRDWLSLNARMAKTTLVDSADAPAGETGPALRCTGDIEIAG